MKSSPFLFTFVVALLFVGRVHCQDEHDNHTDHEHHQDKDDRLRHSIAFLVSHTHITKGIRNGDTASISVPSFGLNYNYRIAEKWAIGLHTDIIIEEFVVERSIFEGGRLERELPLATILAGTYKIIEGLGLVAGLGAEWEKNENFALIRLGTDYGIHIPGPKMEVIIGLNYDILIDSYNSLNFGIGIAKLF